MNGSSNISKKERRELRRQDREREHSAERRRAQIKKISKWLAAAGLGILILGGIFYFISRSGPSSDDFSTAIPILDRSHVPRPTPVADYNSNPPTSGRHWSDANAPIVRGVHDEEQPDEAVVHNLEHGEVWISYHPRIPEEAKEELRKITKDFPKVVLTPRSKNDTDVALAAWGRLDKFNLDGKPLDTKRVEDFIKRYRNKGPELVP